MKTRKTRATMAGVPRSRAKFTRRELKVGRKWARFYRRWHSTDPLDNRHLLTPEKVIEVMYASGISLIAPPHYFEDGYVNLAAKRGA